MTGVTANELSNERLFREVGKKTKVLLKRSDIVNDPAQKGKARFDRTHLEEGDQRLNKFPGRLTDETKMTGAQRVEAISAKYHEKDRVRLERIAKRKK